MIYFRLVDAYSDRFCNTHNSFRRIKNLIFPQIYTAASSKACTAIYICRVRRASIHMEIFPRPNASSSVIFYFRVKSPFPRVFRLRPYTMFRSHSHDPRILPIHYVFGFGTHTHTHRWPNTTTAKSVERAIPSRLS